MQTRAVRAVVGGQDAGQPVGQAARRFRPGDVEKLAVPGSQLGDVVVVPFGDTEPVGPFMGRGP